MKQKEKSVLDMWKDDFYPFFTKERNELITAIRVAVFHEDEIFLFYNSFS